jgi:hypothetical protein
MKPFTAHKGTATIASASNSGPVSMLVALWYLCYPYDKYVMSLPVTLASHLISKI